MLLTKEEEIIMKEELLERLEIEVKACKRYTERAKENARKEKIGTAINNLEIANTAKTCALQVHEELWEVSKVNLTDEEFELFAQAETLEREVQEAYEEIKKTRKK